MQLKSLQIQGFKSFPDKTELTFGTGLTAVVGPNGSGKSNISDAVRWVLGEQSTRSLRGEKMEDVIFLGTSSRKPTGFASVALTIDNTDRQLAVDADEVTIARRLYRSGESEYRINKTAVRLKDVTELLMDTGLGRDGYSIIGQGRIEEIVSSKPTQRREIFEEAAGISKYRYRKAEAEKKLESAYENLLRLKDIMAELQDRLEPLREQSEKAQRFLQLSEEKKTLEISLWTHTMENTRQRLEEEQQQVLLEKNELSDIQALLAEQQHRLEEGFEQVQQLTVQIDTGRQQIAQMKNSLSGCDSGIAVAENDLVHNQRSIDEAHEEILSYTQGKDETKQRFRENQEQLLQKQKLLEKAQQDESLRLNEVDSIEQELRQLTTESAQMKGSRAALEQDITRQKLNRVSSSALLEETQNRLQSLNDHYSERQQNIESLKKELEECTQLLDGIDQRTLSLENAKAGYGLKYQNQQNQLEQLQQELNRMQSQCDQLRHREGILTEMEKSLDGYYNSVKNVLSAAGQGRLKGIVGTVSQVISVQPQYALAIETVLGGALQNLITEDQESAKNAIRHLQYARAGRATFLPLSVITPQQLAAPGIEQMEGFVARASDLAQSQPRYRSIVENLLGRVAVAQDIDAAVTIAKKYSYKFRVVTLDGQLVNAGGSMTGGSASKSTGLLSRREEIRSLQEQIQSLEQQMDSKRPALGAVQQQLAKLGAQLNGVQAQLTSCQQDKITYTSEHKRVQMSYEEALRLSEESHREYLQVQAKLEQLKSTSSSADDLIEQVTSRLQTLCNQLEQAKEKQERLGQAKQALGEQHNALRFEMLGLQKDIESLQTLGGQLQTVIDQQNSHVQGLVDKINSLQNNGRLLEKKKQQLLEEKQLLTQQITEQTEQIQQARQQQAQAEQHLTGLRATEKEQIAKRERAAAKLSRSEERRTALQTEYDKLIAKLWDEYNMTRSDALAQAKPIEDEQRWQNRLTELRNKIRALGTVNLAAIEEYGEVEGRYRFLKVQSDDVERSRTELLGLIRELTAQMRQLFSESFEKINQNFRQIFTELFVGGQGNLVLTDPDNILESGIEIHVQPPGKIIKNLSALSGGEKAFVAIAIYFAILKVKPSPFCMLDEIEAALDEVNVTRYARYLKTLSDKTQFIAITHRRGTMEEADILYGVTMQEKGVSRLLQLDVSQLESRLGIRS